MPNDTKRELRAIFDRIASSRALMDVPAMIAEGRELAAAVKGGEATELARYLDAIAAAETSAGASMLAGSAILFLDRVEALDSAAIAEPGGNAAPATEGARAARKTAPADKPPKSAAARKRAPSKRAGGK